MSKKKIPVSARSMFNYETGSLFPYKGKGLGFEALKQPLMGENIKLKAS